MPAPTSAPTSRLRADAPSRATVSVSVVLCCHDVDRLAKLDAAIRSLLGQTRRPHEIVVVADGDQELAKQVRRTWGARVDVISLPSNQGLSAARNTGAKAATGDVVAFLDDDAIAAPTWLAELARCYETYDAHAVGGRMVAALDDRPLYLPSEFDWLVGGTHTGFAAETRIQRVRNTFGSNISFDRATFEALGGFDSAVGRDGDQLLQAEEAALCSAVADETGERLVYTPFATVVHDVDAAKARPSNLLRRAFWQGYSKAMITDTGSPDAEERQFLERLAVDALPRRLVELLAIPVYVAAVGGGYAYGTVREAVRA